MAVAMNSENHAPHIYDRRYAEQYDSFYLHPWRPKHDLNVRHITPLLKSGRPDAPAWLDLCCGQAWHFAQFPESVGKLGVDASAAQLALARERNPDADFIEADVLEVALEPGSFDLVTCFWAAYCYLGDADRIGRLLTRAVTWTRPGGSIYFEILLPSDLESFNDSEFAANTGFRVIAHSHDLSRWQYRDCGGWHEMFSPPVSFFTQTMAPYFTRTESLHDDGFMTHFLALDRRSEGAGESVAEGCVMPLSLDRT